MGWSAAWPPQRWQPIDTDTVVNNLRAALVERNGLVPAGFVPAAFDRWDVLVGEPEGGDPPNQTMANFQYEIEQMLTLVWPYRWWDPTRSQLYTFADLCQDAFGKVNWTYDLTGVSAPWTPAAACFFDELYKAINQLDRIRILPSASESVTRDDVYRLTFGIGDWPTERAATFALFDGTPDGGAIPSMDYDVGMGGEVFDAGSSQQWFLDSREFRMTFATAALTGYTVKKAWLTFATEAPSGSTDYTDTFTAEAVDRNGAQLGTFASNQYGEKTFEAVASAIDTGGNSVFTIRSTRPDTADRPAWTPPGPNYTSTYREGLNVTGPVRLVVQLDLDYK